MAHADRRTDNFERMQKAGGAAQLLSLMLSMVGDQRRADKPDGFDLEEFRALRFGLERSQDQMETIEQVVRYSKLLARLERCTSVMLRIRRHGEHFREPLSFRKFENLRIF